MKNGLGKIWDKDYWDLTHEEKMRRMTDKTPHTLTRDDGTTMTMVYNWPHGWEIII